MLEPIQIEAMDLDTILGNLRYRLDQLMGIDPDQNNARALTEPLIHEVHDLFAEMDGRLSGGVSGLPSHWAKGLGRLMERHALDAHENYVQRRARSSDLSCPEVDEIIKRNDRSLKVRAGKPVPAFSPAGAPVLPKRKEGVDMRKATD